MPASLSLQSKAVFTMTTYDHFIFGSGKLHFKYKKLMCTHYKSGDRPFYPCFKIRYIYLQIWHVKSYLPIPRKVFMTMSVVTKRLWLFVLGKWWCEVTAEPVQTISGPEKKVFFFSDRGYRHGSEGCCLDVSVICCAVSRSRQGTS